MGQDHVYPQWHKSTGLLLIIDSFSKETKSSPLQADTVSEPKTKLIAMGNCAESSCGGPLALYELILTSSGIRCAQVIPVCQASRCTQRRQWSCSSLSRKELQERAGDTSVSLLPAQCAQPCHTILKSLQTAGGQVSPQAQASACPQQVGCIQYDSQLWFAMKKAWMPRAVTETSDSHCKSWLHGASSSASHLSDLLNKPSFRLDPSLQGEPVMLSRVTLPSPRHI